MTDSTRPATRVKGIHLQAPNDLTPRLLAIRQPTSSTHTSQREAGPSCPETQTCMDAASGRTATIESSAARHRKGWDGGTVDQSGGARPSVAKS